MRITVLIAASTLGGLAGCTGESSGPPPAAVEHRAPPPDPSKDARVAVRRTKVVLESPTNSVAVRLGEPIACRGTVATPVRLDAFSRTIAIEIGRTREGIFHISSTGMCDAQDESEGRYRFEVRLPADRTPVQPGSYEIRAVLVGINTLPEFTNLPPAQQREIASLESATNHFRVEP